MFTLYMIARSAKNSNWVNLNVTNIGQVSPNWPIFRNRDIVYSTKRFKKSHTHTAIYKITENTYSHHQYSVHTCQNDFMCQSINNK